MVGTQIGTSDGQHFENTWDQFLSNNPKLALNEPYPDSYEAEYARQNQAGYGQAIEPFMEGKRANVYGQPVLRGVKPNLKPDFIPTGIQGRLEDISQNLSSRSQMIDPVKEGFPAKSRIQDIYAKAFLASQRSAITSLGFDPRAATLDVKTDSPSTVGGAYNMYTDKMWASQYYPSALVHESTHRGLQHLINKNPEAKGIYDSLVANGVSDEYMTRYIMHSKMGGVEKGSGSAGDRQVTEAIRHFEKSPSAKDNLNKLNRLEDLAAQEIGKRGRHPASLEGDNVKVADASGAAGIGMKEEDFQKLAPQSDVVSQHFNPAAGVPVDNTHDVPYGAGASKEGDIVHIDRHIPRSDPRIKGKNGPADLYKYLSIHELTEKKMMDQGMSYEEAHTKFATPAERKAVEQDGVDWKKYSDVMDGFLSHIEHENPQDPPPNLYLKPYAHTEKAILEQHGVKADTDAPGYTMSVQATQNLENTQSTWYQSLVKKLEDVSSGIAGDPNIYSMDPKERGPAVHKQLLFGILQALGMGAAGRVQAPLPGGGGLPVGSPIARPYTGINPQGEIYPVNPSGRSYTFPSVPIRGGGLAEVAGNQAEKAYGSMTGMRTTPESIAERSRAGLAGQEAVRGVAQETENTTFARDQVNRGQQPTQVSPQSQSVIDEYRRAVGRTTPRRPTPEYLRERETLDREAAQRDPGFEANLPEANHPEPDQHIPEPPEPYSYDNTPEGLRQRLSGEAPSFEQQPWTGEPWGRTARRRSHEISDVKAKDVKISNINTNPGGHHHNFEVLNEEGKSIAGGSISIDSSGTQGHVGTLYDHDNKALGIGTKNMLQLARQAKAYFPELERITATRMSGARYGPAATGVHSPFDLNVKNLKPAPGIEPHPNRPTTQKEYNKSIRARDPRDEAIDDLMRYITGMRGGPQPAE